MIWSQNLSDGLDCPLDEITWLDRRLLSANGDPTLHRSPRCAGVRYVDHGWELFSHDASHDVYVAPYADKASLASEIVRATARHVLPAARGRLQPYPVRLDNGSWMVCVGNWVVVLDVDGPGDRRGSAAVTDHGAATQEHRSRASESSARGLRARPLPDAVQKVRAYFGRKTIARIAIAYYYQEFIVGAVGPQPVPMIEVATALDLTGEAAVSEYKKELQRLAWNEQGHQRELAEFLISSNLISKADVEIASRMAAANERSGKTTTARARLRYRQQRRHNSRAPASF